MIDEKKIYSQYLDLRKYGNEGDNTIWSKKPPSAEKIKALLFNG
jgi:hypothetical protein